MIDIKKDLSQLTGVAEYNIQSLFDKINLIISHTVCESLIEHRNETSIDLGFGNLIIYINDDNIVYKFIPSNKLETSISTYTEMCDRLSTPLTKKCDKVLGERINSTYKELF